MRKVIVKGGKAISGERAFARAKRIIEEMHTELEGSLDDETKRAGRCRASIGKIVEQEPGTLCWGRMVDKLLK